LGLVENKTQSFDILIDRCFQPDLATNTIISQLPIRGGGDYAIDDLRGHRFKESECVPEEDDVGFDVEFLLPLNVPKKNSVGSV